MKRIAAFLISICMLSGCSKNDTHLNKAMDFRKQLLAAQGCSFDADIYADFGEDVYTFQMSCTGDSTGKITFVVTDPESISGITGFIDETAASVTFHDNILAFPVLADGQLSPVSAPWLFLKTIRGGYLSACGSSGDRMLISMDDSFSENAFHMDIYADSEAVPVAVEIFWQQKRIISLEIKNFTLL